MTNNKILKCIHESRYTRTIDPEIHSYTCRFKTHRMAQRLAGALVRSLKATGFIEKQHLSEGNAQGKHQTPETEKGTVAGRPQAVGY